MRKGTKTCYGLYIPSLEDNLGSIWETLEEAQTQADYIGKDYTIYRINVNWEVVKEVGDNSSFIK